MKNLVLGKMDGKTHDCNKFKIAIHLGQFINIANDLF